jgi:osmoprotectant transport system ATP-binding protein
MDNPMISLTRVSKSFDGGRTFAVRGIDLAIAARELVAIVGDSGSGKTTLLKTINRLIDPDEGQVQVGGQPVAATPPHSLRRQIGYVFQSIGLFPHLSVAENIGVTPSLLGWPDSEIRARTAELMDLVELPRTHLTRRPAELSGGQQQRVGIARALAARPSIMLMDEPFGALDPITRDALGTEYRRIHEQTGLTTLMVTHDVMEAILLADRIAVMRQGEIIAFGEPHTLFLEHTDARVRALMDMPRRHAERVRALLQERARSG